MKKKILAIVLAVTTVFTGISWPHRVQAAEIELNVAYHTQDEIREYIQSNGAVLNAPLNFAEEPLTEAPYGLGQLSDDTLTQALKMLNQIRFIAGIGHDVTLSEELNEKAQAAALVNYVNNALSHYPDQPGDMSDEMYNLAYAGTTSSNLAWHSWAGHSLNSSLVLGWMEDGDAYNIPMIGHRRWVLNPRMGLTGFGAVSGSNGTYSAHAVFDRSNSDADEWGVAWPAQNMPVEYFNEEFPWSVSMGEAVTASEIQVTLTRVSDGTEWNFSESSADGSFYVNNDGYGQKGCIIFRPDSINGYEPGEEYQVSIAGLEDGTLNYSVEFFSLDEPEKGTEDSEQTDTETSGGENSSEQTTEEPDSTESSSEQTTEQPGESDTENSGGQLTETELEGNFGVFQGLLGEKYTFTIENGDENWRYEWRRTKGDAINNEDYTMIFLGKSYEIMLTAPAAEYTYWCHVTDEWGNEADSKPCQLKYSLDEAYVANGICGENITWTLDDAGVLTLEGSGSFKISHTSWTGYEEQITSAVIGEGITEIGLWAFSQLKTLHTVSLPRSLKVIDDYAFYQCGLTDISIPEGVEKIGKQAFFRALENAEAGICLPESLQMLGEAAFVDAGVAYIYIPEGVTEIGAYAFDGVTLVKCKEGSYAEVYAIENGVPYETVVESEGEENGKEEDTTTYPIENSNISLENTIYYYDGYAKMPVVTVEDAGRVLQQGVDYIVSYSNNINPGTAVVTVTGMGKYTGYKRAVFQIERKNSVEDVVIPTGTPEPEPITYISGTDIPAKITLYRLDEKWSSFLTMPENFRKSYQMNPAGGTFSVLNGDTVSVDSAGTITANETYGESVLRFTKDNKAYDILVEVVDYAEYYAQNIMKLYVEESVITAETDLEKLERISAFVAAHDYSGVYSGYTGMILSGGGDCLASSSAILYMCELVGLSAKLRYAVNDPGAGNGHRNVAVRIGNEIYIADAGIAGMAPRPYLINKTEQGWSYYQTGENAVKLIQYDGFDEQVMIPESINGKLVTAIGEGAFYYGIGFSGAQIKSVTIPSAVTEIGDYAFSRSGTLEAIYVDEENSSFASENGVLFDKSKESLLAYPTAKTGAYVVPSGVKTIVSYAFSDMSGITSIQIPESVNLIEERAFEDCLNLREIRFMGNAPVIEDYAFYWVNATAYHPLNNTTWTSDKYQSYGGVITWLAWNENETDGEQNNGSGGNSTGDTTGNVGGSHISNGQNGNNAGTGQSGSNSGSQENGSGSQQYPQINHIGNIVQLNGLKYRVISETEVTVTGLVAAGKKIRIPNTVSYMGKTYRVTGISAKAFKNKKITQVIIGKNVKTIGNSAFEGCKKLVQVTVGSGVTKIGKNAFKNSKLLKKIVIKSAKLKSVGSNALKGIKATATVKVPKKKFLAYKKLLKKTGIGRKVKIKK